MRVRWLQTAIENLNDAAEYIARDSSTAASKVVNIINALSQRLADYPSLGRSGRVPGTRELVVPGTPYIIVYRVRSAHIEIIRIFHGARKWPAYFDE